MKVAFWGTRGSLAAPGPDTCRYGGNTSCVTLQDAESGRVLVLDAGSGIRRVGRWLEQLPGRVDVLLTHLHMDHIQGLGFFAPLAQPAREVHLWGPPTFTRSLRRRLVRYLSPPLFPVRLGDLPARALCHDVLGGSWEIGPFRVRAELLIHPGPTLGYRVSCRGSTVAYLPDHEPQLGRVRNLADGAWLSGFALAEGVDLLIHDAQYTDEEYAHRVGWGHSTMGVAVAFAERVGARRLALFHHDPSHSDAMLEGVWRELARGREHDIFLAAESTQHVVLPGSSG